MPSTIAANVARLQPQLVEQPKRAFEFTYVDVNLPNSQKRLKVVLRSETLPNARHEFNLWNGKRDCRFKAIAVDEILPEPSKASLEALLSRQTWQSMDPARNEGRTKRFHAAIQKAA